MPVQRREIVAHDAASDRANECRRAETAVVLRAISLKQKLSASMCGRCRFVGCGPRRAAARAESDEE